MPYVQLRVLMGTYFGDGFGGLNATLREFLDDSTDDDIRTLVSDIDAFLSTTSPRDIAPALAEFGNRLWLGEEPRPYAVWLHDVRESALLRLQRTSTRQPATNDGRPILDRFLDDIDEVITAEGQILVGHFVWILRGMRADLTYEQMQDLSQTAYAVVRERYRTRLMWSAWPTDLATARIADETAPLEFDLDPDAPVDIPILVLVLLDD